MSDVVWQALIAALLAMYMEWSRRQAAGKVENVRKSLASNNSEAATSMENLTAVADATHALVNSQHGIALATVYEQAMKIAELTGDPADRAKAERAKRNLVDHEHKQARVDDRKDAKS